MKKVASKVFLVIMIFMLSACGGGGGGDDSSASGTAEGLWKGTVNTNRSCTGLVLNDGAYWVIYSVAGNSDIIAGVVQGNGTSNSGSFTSTNGKDFNLEGSGINDFTLTSNYTAKSSFSGSLTYLLGGSSAFASSYSADYELIPNLTVISGNYSGNAATSGGIDSATVNISNLGIISGIGASGCVFTGTVEPRTVGNVYNVSVTFGGGVCDNGTDTVTGVAYFNSEYQKLTSAAVNSTRTDGFIYTGTKQ